MNSLHYNYLLLFIIIFILQANLSLENDLVTSLPDYPYYSTFYSGYLNVNSYKQFHYILNPSNSNGDKKPLILWLNGGPGCSSLEGWATENGPLKLDSDGNFIYNEYSWNLVANMLYIESPGNVGYSYIDSTSDYELEVNDDIVAEDNLKALLDFFNKYPSYKGKDFYISGQSYAGIYIPYLAYKILKYNEQVVSSKKINLKGIIVGNGITDFEYDATPAMIDFAFTHHLTSYENRKDYNKYCITEIDNSECNKVKEKIDMALDNINIYDYLRECSLPNNEYGLKNYFDNYYLKSPWAFYNLEKKQQELKEKIKLMQKKGIENITKNNFKYAPPCIDDKPMVEYFNREDVKTALHITTNNKWELCSLDISQRYNKDKKGSIWAYPILIKNNIKILVYSGDTDMSVPFNGNQEWIENLELEVEKPWKMWRAYDDWNNAAGYYIKYKGLTFCTIKGVGLKTGKWKGKETFYMLNKFINNEDF